MKVACEGVSKSGGLCNREEERHGLQRVMAAQERWLLLLVLSSKMCVREKQHTCLAAVKTSQGELGTCEEMEMCWRVLRLQSEGSSWRSGSGLEEGLGWGWGPAGDPHSIIGV